MWVSAICTSDRGDFWAQPVEIPVFASPPGYMLTSSSFPLLKWGIFSKFLYDFRWFSCSSLELQPVISQTQSVTNCRFSPIIDLHRLSTNLKLPFSPPLSSVLTESPKTKELNSKSQLVSIHVPNLVEATMKTLKDQVGPKLVSGVFGLHWQFLLKGTEVVIGLDLI